MVMKIGTSAGNSGTGGFQAPSGAGNAGTGPRASRNGFESGHHLGGTGPKSPRGSRSQLPGEFPGGYREIGRRRKDLGEFGRGSRISLSYAVLEMPMFYDDKHQVRIKRYIRNG